MRRTLIALAALAAIAVPVGTANAAAPPKLPKPKSTVIKPNAGIGKVALGAKMKPRPKGWKNPFKCMSLQGLNGCVWTTRRDALPPQGQQGIAGSFVMVMGRKRVAGFIVSSGAKDVDTASLRKWRTPNGIGFTSTLEEFVAAFPTAERNPSTGSYKLLANGNITVFVFTNNVLNTIEMYTCEEYRDC